MKMMSDLNDKKEGLTKGYHVPEDIPHDMGKRTTSQLFYKKLGAYLILLYRSYLKGETFLKPAIKLAIWRMIKFNAEFSTKIEMIQLEELDIQKPKLNSEWEEAKELLFPDENIVPNTPLGKERAKVIDEYKEVVEELLESYP